MTDFNKKEEYRFPIKDLDFSAMATNFLSAGMGLDYLGELTEKTVDDIKNARGFNRKHLEEIRAMLRTKGLTLKGDPDPENKEKFQIPMK